MNKVPLTAQIMEIDYELDMRGKVYPAQVQRGKLKQAEANLHTRQLQAVRETLVFCQDHAESIRMATTLQRQANGGRSVIGLIEDSLATHRQSLAAMVADNSELLNWEGEYAPAPGTLAQGAAETVRALISLVRELERLVGRPADHTQPQWLDDLLDGAWSPFVEDEPSGGTDSAEQS